MEKYIQYEQYTAVLAPAGNTDTTFIIQKPSILVSYFGYNNQSNGSLNLGFNGTAATNIVWGATVNLARISGVCEIYLTPGSYTLRTNNAAAGNATIKTVITIRELS